MQTKRIHKGIPPIFIQVFPPFSKGHYNSIVCIKAQQHLEHRVALA